MTRCDRSTVCSFYGNHHLKLSARLYEFLIATYCEGELQSRCKRKLWQDEKQVAPPEALLPNGYYVDPSKPHD